MSVFHDTEAMDRRANQYALRCFCVTMAAFTVAWILNLLNIFIVDKAIMANGYYMGLGLFAMCLLVCKVFDLSDHRMKYVLLFFIIAITTVIESMLTYHAVILSVMPIVYSAMYHNTKKMTLYTYFLTIISVIIIVFVGYSRGLCDANMVLLTSKSVAQYIGEDGLFTLNEVNPNPVLTLMLYFVFPRCVLCGVFVPICTNISAIIAQSRLKEQEMRVLAEIDGMTGLYNKSKYLEQVANPYSAEENLAVIFWDVNGLKKINDTLGHEYGDRLITILSDSIKKLSTQKERAYRVGGDEFVMILRGGNEDTVKRKIRMWQESMQGKTVADGIPVTASVGYACGSGSALEAIINRADENMYANKREFYSREAGVKK